ncbi:universal stress protein [Telmatospirillum sp.]|uniref:universal stress protein n=1 Tax=Telmatospirillum sp. TaxID=2079197 RepID=UPI00284CA4EB|nr:universal stress protein [Telmatospirillum sp.]MDR3436258.1 universal stress protein [Telmatospirillum sp.]
MFKTILVAVDASPQTDPVLSQAADLALHLGAEVHVVSVNDATSHWELGVTGPAPALFDIIDQDVFATLDKATRTLAHRGITCHTHAPTGMAAQEIAALAEKIAADMVIIGHRHLSWLGRLMEESVGSSLLARSPCSVLIVVEPHITPPTQPTP